LTETQQGQEAAI